eukprot:2484542-Prymnesium_polylepis.1
MLGSEAIYHALARRHSGTLSSMPLAKTEVRYNYLSASPESTVEMTAHTSGPSFGVPNLAASAMAHLSEISAFVAKAAAKDCGCVRPYAVPAK